MKSPYCGHERCAYCWPYCEDYLIRKMQQEEREYNLEQDRDNEFLLGQEYLENIEDEEDWPFYSELPYEIEEPEIIET